MKVYAIDADNPDPDLIQKAARVILEGRVIAFPTRSLYGLGADGRNAAAVRRIFAIKKRPPTKPILILVSERKQVQRLTPRISAMAGAIMDRFWPGQVTVVIDAGPDVLPELTAGSGKIGVRLTGHPVARALIKAVGRPLTGTSANFSGQPGCADVKEMNSGLIDQLDLVLDAGKLEGGAGSTVVDVTGDRPKVLRQGAVSATEIEAAAIEVNRL